MSSGTPVQRRKLGVCMAKRKQKMKRLDHGGYSLVELMVVIVIMKKPNDPDSPLYLYVGEDTDDCTDFTLSFKNTGDGKMEINGFTYTADTYEIRWTEDDGVKVTME